MPRPIIGRIYLVDKNGGIVCTATYRTHPMLRERDLAHDGILYRQSRQTVDGYWVYQEQEPTSEPNTAFVDNFDIPAIPPARTVTITDAYALIDEMQKGGSINKLADLRSILDAVQLKEKANG